MKIYTEEGAPSVIILKPECYADTLVIAKMREDACKQEIDCHEWSNEDGRGLTFFLKAER